MAALPTESVTLLLTDIVSSTRQWEEHPEATAEALDLQDRLAAEITARYEGRLVKSRGEGDSLFIVFGDALHAVAAACDLQKALLRETWPVESPLRVRMALHTGEVVVRNDDYYGPVVNRCARLRSAAHAGQVLLSEDVERAVRSRLPAYVSLRDLGRHQLKDLRQPERLFQVIHPDLPGDFPPPRALQAFAHNLPCQLTSFIGRSHEMEAIRKQLPTTRLLTLTGAGGCGKTRLALQVAGELVSAYPDGVWFVELASVTDPLLLADAIAFALGVREELGQSVLETLVEHLQHQSVLLLIDNCEHLLPHAAQLTETLLHSCPGLRVLATSREPLGVGGEVAYRVPSLLLPDPARPPALEHLVQYEAIALFLERTTSPFQVNESNAHALAQVCHRLDGIPLAIELAAARVGALSVERIAQRLNNCFSLLTRGSRTALPRQQTLRALIDWSYDLLTPAEQILLRRVSVFAGGWTLEAAEAVCAADVVQKAEIASLLAALVEKSLVIYEEPQGQGRYRLLETVRQYGRERLSSSEEEEAILRRHRDYFRDLAEEIEPRLYGPQQGEWCAYLESDHDNLRAALEHCNSDATGGEVALRLAGALWRFWIIRGHLTEGRQRLTEVIRLGDSELKWWQAKALTAAACLAYMQNDLGEAGRLANEGRAAATEAGHRWCIAVSLIILGVHSQLYARDEARAGVFLHDALELSKALEDRWLQALSFLSLAQLAFGGGDLREVEQLIDQSLRLFRKLEDRWFICFALTFSGMVAFCRDDPVLSGSLHAEGLTLCHQLGYKLGLAQNLEGMAAAALGQGRPEDAARIFGASDALREAMGAPRDLVDRMVYDPAIEAVRNALDEATYLTLNAEGRSMSLAQALALVLG